MLWNSDKSVAGAEGVNFYPFAAPAEAPHSFTYSTTYPTLALIPEPSTLALGGLGLIGCAVDVVRRRRLAA